MLFIHFCKYDEDKWSYYAQLLSLVCRLPKMNSWCICLCTHCLFRPLYFVPPKEDKHEYTKVKNNSFTHTRIPTLRILNDQQCVPCSSCPSFFFYFYSILPIYLTFLCLCMSWIFQLVRFNFKVISHVVYCFWVSYLCCFPILISDFVSDFFSLLLLKY